MPKKTTIDDLAAMVKHGFDQMATKEDIVQLRTEMASKEDLKQFATKDDLRKLEQKLAQKMDAGFFAVNSRIDLLHDDLSDLPDIREAVQDHSKRIERLEQQAGLTQ